MLGHKSVNCFLKQLQHLENKSVYEISETVFGIFWNMPICQVFTEQLFTVIQKNISQNVYTFYFKKLKK